MNYIKRFNESINDPTYEEITRSEWDSIVENRLLLTDTKYPEIIKKFITDNILYNNAKFEISQAGKRIIITSGIFYTSKNWDLGIDVCPDEWFVIHINKHDNGYYKFYKCDQLDGLFDFLKNMVEW